MFSTYTKFDTHLKPEQVPAVGTAASCVKVGTCRRRIPVLLEAMIEESPVICDPWQCDVTSAGCNDGKFDDDFRFVPLPDKTEYLAKLETKLAKMRADSSGSQQKRRRALLDALSASRSDHVTRFLEDDEFRVSGSCDSIDADSTASRLLRIVAPERLALTTEELVALLKADELDAVTSSSSCVTASEDDVTSTGDDHGGGGGAGVGDGVVDGTSGAETSQ
ncbi:unnamed protein product [Notodromas monacha]|uniref:Uncharacterized protein n=1 Tax=Notodromas monacha TaxID=399045 RepID=A0A7R9BXW7_9CRUS|nr:unnamed protein product [Notodromas monacha]CAG0922274.1 unnamed protein product [Notodromas monacha]